MRRVAEAMIPPLKIFYKRSSWWHCVTGTHSLPISVSLGFIYVDSPFREGEGDNLFSSKLVILESEGHDPEACFARGIPEGQAGTVRAREDFKD